MRYIQASQNECVKAAEMNLKLWPNHSLMHTITAVSSCIKSNDSAIYLACDNGKYVGFAQCSLHDTYVDGGDMAPVCTLEGVYVEKEYRDRGIGKRLVECCERWAVIQGAMEFTAKCVLENEDGVNFYMKAGFDESSRIVHFAKRLI